MLLTLAACLQIGYAYAAPLPPSNVNVLITDNSSFPAKAIINWKDNSNNEEGFSLSLYFGTTSELGYSYIFTSAPANATSTNADIYSTSSVPMYVGVSANSAGTSSQKAFSNPFVGGVAPLAPSDILVTKQSQSTGSSVPVTISWKDNSTNELYFIVKAYYAGSMKPVLSTINNYPVQGTVDSGFTSYTFSGKDLINQIPATTTPLYFTVSAMNYYGGSVEVKSSDITLVSAPVAPSNVTASSPAGQSVGKNVPVTVTWTDNSINEDIFFVRAFYGATQKPVLDGMGISPLTARVQGVSVNATGTRSYTFTTMDQILQVPATTTPLYFTVSAMNYYGGSVEVKSSDITLVSAPVAPSNVTASSPAGQSVGKNVPVTVTWTDNSINEDIFFVRAFYGATQKPVLDGMGISPLTARVQGISVNATGTRSYTFTTTDQILQVPATTTPIYFTVTAVNPYGESTGASSVATAFVQATTTPVIVAAPAYIFAFPYSYLTYFTATSTRSTSLAYVYWSAVPTVTGYIMERRMMLSATTTSTVGYMNILLPSTTTSYIDRSVVAGKTYTYTIRATKGTTSSVTKVSSPITIPVPR